jgi:hypothetical protein
MEQYLSNIGRKADNALGWLLKANLLAIIIHHHNGPSGWPGKTQ